MQDPWQEDGQGALGAAIRRLDRAVEALEQKLESRLAESAPGPDLFEQDRARLAEALEAARTRERALELVAAEASAALGRAAAEVRAALAAEER